MRVGQGQAGGLTRLCSLAGLSRQAYYRHRLVAGREPLRHELIIQEVLGYRELQPRIGGRKLYLLAGPFLKLHGMEMGRDAFFKMLGKYGLLNRKRRKKPRTTDSDHWMRRYPDLTEKLVPSRCNQLWVSDITYLHLCKGDVFLSLVTDAYSRKIVGFHVSRSLEATGCMLALKMAISDCGHTKGLIHHSDRGAQYCCKDYVALLNGAKMLISMTQGGDPRDNAIAERVNGILKMELLAPVFTSLEAAREAVTKAVGIYNYLRPHSSISMLAPALLHGRKIAVKRCWKNYYHKRKTAQKAAEEKTENDTAGLNKKVKKEKRIRMWTTKELTTS